ncbi:MAG: VIT1/CCC1 transporter family protein [Patescibacteria group bacterium]
MKAGGRYIKDIVYGANDGVITTFAIIAGVAGANITDPRTTIIILGVANVLADGFSMAASNYLGSKSERDVVEREYRDENIEVTQDPDTEREEMTKLLREEGYADGDARSLSHLMLKNKAFFVDLLMHEEFGVSNHERGPILARSLLTFIAFVVAGLLPVLPFLVFSSITHIFLYSIISTGVVLFILGALRALITKRSFFLSGLEMFLIGGFAASIAYGVGVMLHGVAGIL